MAKETTYAGKLGDWQRLLEPVTANAADLAHLEVPRTQMAAVLAKAVAATKEQAVHKAAKQDLSKQLVDFILEGDRLANLLRVAVKQHYGIRSEKLAEFGLQPFRGRKAKAAPETPSPSTPPVTASSTPQA
jgi:hypothetical protein